MLDRVHRQARPRADIDIAMVQRVKAVHQARVQKSVHPVEIKALPDGDQEEDRDEPDGVCVKRDNVGIAVGHRPPEQAFECGPNCDARGNGPEHVVEELAVEREHPAHAGEWARIVF